MYTIVGTKMTTELRKYQSEGKIAVLNELDNKINRQLVVMATGLGKTRLAISIMEDFNRILWITHKEELIEQSALAIINEEFKSDPHLINQVHNHNGIINALKTFERNPEIFEGQSDLFEKDFTTLADHIGIIKQERLDLDAKIVVASIQTLHRRLDKIDPNLFDLIVIDECHLAIAKTWTKACNHFNPKLLLGLTATPWRTDGVSLGHIFDKIVFERDLYWGVKNGFLCSIDAIRLKTDQTLDDVRTTAGEFNHGDLKKLNTASRNYTIVEKYIQYASQRQTLVFAVDVQHARDLYEAFTSRGIKASFIVADESVCPNRKERIDGFKNGLYDVLINVEILTTGFDHPEVSCILMARPTKSKTLYLQCIGRGTRLKSGPIKDLLILDVVDNTQKHQLINTWTLEQDVELEDRVFISELKKDKIREERKRRLAEIVKQPKRDEHINLLELPKIYIAKTIRTRQPATQAQLDYMKVLGYDVENNDYTLGQCMELIGNTPATEKQMWRLNKLGYDISKGATKAQASKVIEEYYKDIENGKQQKPANEQFKNLF